MQSFHHHFRSPKQLVGAACLVGLACTISPSAVLAAGDGDDPTEIISDQLRDQGYACENPDGAKRDPEDSRPEEEAWIVDCGNASYRVRLIPDQAAQVERLD